MNDAAMQSVRVDCSAFEFRGGDWVTRKATTVLVGLDDATAGRIELPAGITIRSSMFRPNGVDLVDVLFAKCIKRN